LLLLLFDIVFALDSPQHHSSSCFSLMLFLILRNVILTHPWHGSCSSSTLLLLFLNVAPPFPWHYSFSLMLLLFLFDATLTSFWCCSCSSQCGCYYLTPLLLSTLLWYCCCSSSQHFLCSSYFKVVLSPPPGPLYVFIGVGEGSSFPSWSYLFSGQTWKWVCFYFPSVCLFMTFGPCFDYP
jgi:hypothetical protein